MGFLFRKTITSRKPDGTKAKSKSKKWYARYKDALDIVRETPLSTNKQAAQAMLSDLEKRVELEKAGIVDPFSEHRKRTLAEHVDDFAESLASRGNTAKHVSMTKTQSLAVLDGIKATFLQDLSAASVERFLAEMRKSGRSARTSNSYLRSIKSFSRWMTRNRRIPEDVLAILSAVNEKADRRHERRALNPEDLNRLISAAEVGPVVAGLTGLERSHLYRTAAMTGLRASELASLKPTSFNFESMELTVEAKSSKHREEDVLPIHEELAGILRPWLATKAQDAPIWSGPWASSNQAAPMIRADLEAAGIPYRDESGKVADFHSLRTSFVTNLIKSGVSVKQAQALARHSTPTLTLGTYTALTSTDLASGLAKLPGLGTPTTSEPEAMKATGTGEIFAPLFAPDQCKVVPFGSSSFRDEQGQNEIDAVAQVVQFPRENSENTGLDRGSEASKNERRRPDSNRGIADLQSDRPNSQVQNRSTLTSADDSSLHSYLHQKPENTPPSTIPLDLGLAKLIAVWGSLPATKRKAVLRAAGIKPTR